MDNCDNVLRQTFPIPVECLGFVIGRNGHTIQAIESRSQCKLSIRECDSISFNRKWAFCTITGETGHHINTAKQLIILNIMQAQTTAPADEL